jgi:hypothetical protein
MKIASLAAVLFFGAGHLFGADEAPHSAASIMEKVAENQDREQQARASFVYEESIRVTTRHTSGKLAREESADYLVTPTSKGTDKKCVLVRGRYWHKGRYINFSGEPIPDADSLDGELASSFRNDLINNNSKDGLGKDLFPLTTEEQKDLKFDLVGEETVSGRRAYRIRFAPIDQGDVGWAGEALVDKDEFEPISVYTRLSRRIPLFARTVLGTDLPGFGFSTRYTRVDKDVWFPVTFGTEFRLRAVFFINRTITVAMESKNFRRATADSRISYEDTPKK